MPVRAWPMRSLPASARGSVSSWMAKVRVMPASASAATTSGWTSKSLNSGAVSATGAPPSASTACSTCSGAGAPLSAWSISGVVGVFSVWVFSVEVRVLASGRLGERPGATVASPGRSAVGCRGMRSSADAASGPGRTGTHPVPGGGSSGRLPTFVSAQIPADLAARLFPW